MTKLLATIWQDQAATPAACAEMRRLLYSQVWPHRLRSGFGAGIRIGGKTGTLPGIKNEVGVVEYPDGCRYAVAVYTRSTSVFEEEPTSSLRAADLAIGTAARLAVEELR